MTSIGVVCPHASKQFVGTIARTYVRIYRSVRCIVGHWQPVLHSYTGVCAATTCQVLAIATCKSVTSDQSSSALS